MSVYSRRWRDAKARAKASEANNAQLLGESRHSRRLRPTARVPRRAGRSAVDGPHPRRPRRPGNRRSERAHALELLKQHRFDLLISDIGMPDLDGYELMRRVRLLDSSHTRPIPAIAVTAYARAEDRQRSLLAGYQMHLAKPIEARELVAGITSLLQMGR
jgi:CheY-like chemotaxis protein